MMSSFSYFLLLAIFLETRADFEFIQMPDSLICALNSKANFSCQAEINSTYAWWINDNWITYGNSSEEIRVTPIPDGTILSLTCTETRNMSRVMCAAFSVSDPTVRNFSDEATLLIQGQLRNVTNLTILSSNSTSLTLTWVPPFSLNITGLEPDFNYTIEVYNDITGNTTTIELEGGPTVDSFVFTPDNPDPTVLYEFVITADNGLEGEPSDPIEACFLEPTRDMRFSSTETHITVTWTPPECPLELTYCVNVTNPSDSAVLNTTCDITAPEFVFTMENNPNPDDMFKISVIPIALSSIESREESFVSAYFIGKPVVILKQDVKIHITLDPLNVNFSISEQLVSASPGRRPSSYRVLATGDSSQCQCDDAITVTMDGVITLLVGDCSGCLSQGEEYSFVIETLNVVGTSFSEKIVLGTGHGFFDRIIEALCKIITGLIYFIAFLFMFLAVILVITFVCVCVFVKKIKRKWSPHVEEEYQRKHPQKRADFIIHYASMSKTAPVIPDETLSADTEPKCCDLLLRFDVTTELCDTVRNELLKHFGEGHYACIDLKQLKATTQLVITHDLDPIIKIFLPAKVNTNSTVTQPTNANTFPKVNSCPELLSCTTGNEVVPPTNATTFPKVSSCPELLSCTTGNEEAIEETGLSPDVGANELTTKSAKITLTDQQKPPSSKLETKVNALSSPTCATGPDSESTMLTRDVKSTSSTGTHPTLPSHVYAFNKFTEITVMADQSGPTLQENMGSGQDIRNSDSGKIDTKKVNVNLTAL